MSPLYNPPIPTQFCQDAAASAAALPANHFLSCRALTPPPKPSAFGTRYWSGRARPDTSSLAAADYDVNVQTGFLPPQPPVQRLGAQIGGGWEEVEILLEAAQAQVLALAGGGVGRIGEAWRSAVRTVRLPRPMTQLTASSSTRPSPTYLSHCLTCAVRTFSSPSWATSTFTRRSPRSRKYLPRWRCHGSPSAIGWAFRLFSRMPIRCCGTGSSSTPRWASPPSTSIPFFCARLTDRCSNVAIHTTFTSSASERAFFLLSLLCELHAPTLLRLMSATLDESFFSDSLALPRIAAHLLRIGGLIDDISGLIDAAMRGPIGVDQEEIGAECFYWEIRPWFNGGKWEYAGVADGRALTMEWGGPSAGQSSLIHAIDLFLGVDHSPRPSSDDAVPTRGAPMARTSSTASMDPESPLPPVPTAVASSGPSSDATFMLRASQYMPMHHRSFLLHLSSLSVPSSSNPHPLPPLRSLAQSNVCEIGDSFNEAVASMKRFRDYHMKIATRFIISQARREPSRKSVFWTEWNEKRVKKAEEDANGREQREEKHTGTGGTELVTFLKGCRERTVEAHI